MGIPKEIKREHIFNALAEIERRGFSDLEFKRHKSIKYDLLCASERYYPKLVVSLAYKYVPSSGGKEWPTSRFHGGKETNRFLKKLGFEIIHK